MYEVPFSGQTAYAETRTILSGLQTQFCEHGRGSLEPANIH